MKMPKKANDMLIVIAADKAAKNMGNDPKKVDESVEQDEGKEYCCPSCRHCGPEAEFEE